MPAQPDQVCEKNGSIPSRHIRHRRGKKGKEGGGGGEKEWFRSFKKELGMYPLSVGFFLNIKERKKKGKVRVS